MHCLRINITHASHVGGLTQNSTKPIKSNAIISNVFMLAYQPPVVRNVLKNYSYFSKDLINIDFSNIFFVSNYVSE